MGRNIKREHSKMVKRIEFFIEWDKNGLKIKEEIFQDNALIKVNRH